MKSLFNILISLVSLGIWPWVKYAIKSAINWLMFSVRYNWETHLIVSVPEGEPINYPGPVRPKILVKFSLMGRITVSQGRRVKPHGPSISRCLCVDFKSPPIHYNDGHLS